MTGDPRGCCAARDGAVEGRGTSSCELDRYFRIGRSHAEQREEVVQVVSGQVHRNRTAERARELEARTAEIQVAVRQLDVVRGSAVVHVQTPRKRSAVPCRCDREIGASVEPCYSGLTQVSGDLNRAGRNTAVGKLLPGEVMRQGCDVEVAEIARQLQVAIVQQLR